jgi:hypothetical protein
LTQFSFYVNANAEALRDCFVDFQGKKTLVVDMPPGTLFSTNFAAFANRMVDEQIATNLKNPDVTSWLLPKFSTTKSEDRVAASVTIMSTLQAYFSDVPMLPLLWDPRSHFGRIARGLEDSSREDRPLAKV